MPISPSHFEYSPESQDDAAVTPCGDSPSHNLWADSYDLPAVPKGIQPVDFLLRARLASKNIEDTYGKDSISCLAAKIAWYYETEKSNGANDIKNLKQCKGNPAGENFGNWLAGAVGECLEIPSWMLVGGAGLYQVYSGTSDISYFDSFFDDPKDTKYIRAGVDWARKSIDRIDRIVRHGEPGLQPRTEAVVADLMPIGKVQIIDMQNFKERYYSATELL